MEPAEEFCNLPCCPDNGGVCMVKPCPTCVEEPQIYTCGGEGGRFSVFYDFAIPVTIGLNVELLNAAGENVVIHYPSSELRRPPGVKNDFTHTSQRDKGSGTASWVASTGTPKSYSSITKVGVNITEYKKLNLFEVWI